VLKFAFSIIYNNSNNDTNIRLLEVSIKIEPNTILKKGGIIMKKDMVVLVTEKQQLTKGVAQAFLEELREIAYGHVGDWKDEHGNKLDPVPIKFLQDSCYWCTSERGAIPQAGIAVGYSIGRTQSYRIEYRKGIFKKARVYITSATSEGAILTTDLSVGEWQILMKHVVSKMKSDDKWYLNDLKCAAIEDRSTKVIDTYPELGITNMLDKCNYYAA